MSGGRLRRPLATTVAAVAFVLLSASASDARTFSYDLAGRLASTVNGGTTASYTYDGDDRRLSSTTGGGADLRYTWDPLAESGISELALERSPTGTLVRRYLGGPLGATSFSDGSGTFSVHQDPLGTVTDVTDATGAAQWRYEYEAYGAERSSTNVSGTAPENRLRFTGQYLDAETTLHHLRARQYDPASGRFGAIDSVENPLDRPYGAGYAYVDGQPTSITDPLGLCWPQRLCAKWSAVTREASIARRWTGEVSRNVARDARNLVNGKTLGELAREMNDANKAAGGGVKGRAAAFSVYAYFLTEPILNCIHALATGAGARTTSSECGQAAAMVAGPKLGLGRCTPARGTSLYRAVGRQELADIQKSGRYRVKPGGVEGKYFFETPRQASNFARMMGDQPYTTTAVRVSRSKLAKGQRINPVREGPGFLFRTPHVPSGPVSSFDRSVVP